MDVHEIGGCTGKGEFVAKHQFEVRNEKIRNQAEKRDNNDQVGSKKGQWPEYLDRMKDETCDRKTIEQISRNVQKEREYQEKHFLLRNKINKS